MPKIRKILKWAVIGAAVLLLAIQFMGPAKSNPVAPEADSVHARLQVTPAVASIFERSCIDCHSNKTRWPWYSNVAPVSWFVIDHVNHGRSHLNLSEWGSYDRIEAAEMLEEICKEVKSGQMPLSSYTPLHPGSELSADDIKVLCDWTNAELTRIGGNDQTPAK